MSFFRKIGSSIRRNKRLQEFTSLLGCSGNPESVSKLAILTVASCDPECSSEPDQYLCHNRQTILDSIACATFFNRLMVISKCDTAEQASAFSDVYFSYLHRLISCCLGISARDASDFLDNRLIIFENVFLSAPQNQRSSNLLNTYTKLLCADYFSESFTYYRDDFPLPLLDAFEQIKIHISASAFFHALGDYFNSAIAECDSYIHRL